MKNNDSASAYKNNFTISEENRVIGFDPLRFLKMTSNGPKLDLGTKKVWFRLKYPEGRIILRALNITEQIALIEARIFLHKTDTAPMFTSTVQKATSEVPGGLYVQAAQHDAIEQVLDEAGFTVISKSTVNSSPKPSQHIAETPPVTIIVEETPKETVSTTAIVGEAPNVKAVEDTPISMEEAHQAEQMIVENNNEVIETPTVKQETTSEKEKAPITRSTPVEELCETIKVNEALDYIVTSGSCQGWTLSQVLERRRSNIKYFMSPGYKGDDNLLRACSKIIFDHYSEMFAS